MPLHKQIKDGEQFLIRQKRNTVEANIAHADRRLEKLWAQVDFLPFQAPKQPPPYTSVDNSRKVTRLQQMVLDLQRQLQQGGAMITIDSSKSEF